MTDCQKCADHSGVVKSIEAVCLKLDEREKQYVLRDENIKTMISAATEQIGVQFVALNKALGVAERELERRLQELNELRKEVVTDRGQFVRNSVYNDRHELMGNVISSQDRRITVIETRSVTWTAAIGIFFVVFQLILHFVHL